MYPVIIFIHVLSAFLFFMAHGVSIGVALWLKGERQPERLRPLLELSDASRRFVRVGLIGVLLSGITGGFMLNWWRMGWIWVSLGLMLLVSVVMFRGVAPNFHRLRKAVGSPYTEGGKRHPAQEPVSAAELETLFGSLNMLPMVAIGVVILAAIVYLMRFKPF